MRNRNRPAVTRTRIVGCSTVGRAIARDRRQRASATVTPHEIGSSVKPVRASETVVSQAQRFQIVTDGHRIHVRPLGSVSIFKSVRLSLDFGKPDPFKPARVNMNNPLVHLERVKMNGLLVHLDPLYELC